MGTKKETPVTQSMGNYEAQIRSLILSQSRAPCRPSKSPARQTQMQLPSRSSRRAGSLRHCTGGVSPRAAESNRRGDTVRNSRDWIPGDSSGSCISIPVPSPRCNPEAIYKIFQKTASLSCGRPCVCVCVKALTIAKGFWNIDKHLLYSCRGVRHDCGTALNEATTVMGYRV